MDPTRQCRGRASFITAIRNLLTITAPNTVSSCPSMSPIRMKIERNVDLTATPAVIDEDEIRIRRSQRTLCVDQSDSTLITTTIITDTEDDSLLLKKLTNRLCKKTTVAHKIRNQYIRKHTIHHPLISISRESLRSATSKNGVTNRNDLRSDESRCLQPPRPHPRAQSIASTYPAMHSVSWDSRPKRRLIPTDFFQPSAFNTSSRFQTVMTTTDKDSLDCPPCRNIVNQFPNNVSTVQKDTIRPDHLLVQDHASASSALLVSTKRNRIPTNFYRPSTQIKKSVQLIVDKKVERLDAKSVSETRRMLTRSQSVPKEEEKEALNSKHNFPEMKGGGRIQAPLKKAPLRHSKVYIMKSTPLSSHQSKQNIETAETGIAVAQCNCDHSAKAKGIGKLNTPSSNTTFHVDDQRPTISSGTASSERISIRTRSKSPCSVQMEVYDDVPSTRSSSSSCSGPTRTSKYPKENMLGNQLVLNDRTTAGKLSYEVLLSHYNDLVAQGRCYPVFFGRTLNSAILSVDRTLQVMTNKIPDDIADPEILTDFREYKRSLRSFSVYEDREKLALVHEAQEALQICSRTNAQSKKNIPTQHDEWSETLLLCKRPVFMRRSHTMSRRCTLECEYGFRCRFCALKNPDASAESYAFDHTPIPLIEPFDIEFDSDTGLPSSASISSKKRKRHFTKERSSASMEKKHDHCIAKATMEALTELKYSLEFVERYNHGSTFF